MQAKSPLIVFLALCALPVGCSRAPSQASTNAVASIVGSWYSTDYPGLTCEFKSDGTYHAKMVKTGSYLILSADSTYSVDGTMFTGGRPDISTSPNEVKLPGAIPTDLLMWRVMTMTNPAKGTIAWKSADEFTLTHRNEQRGAEETATWSRWPSGKPGVLEVRTGSQTSAPGLTEMTVVGSDQKVYLSKEVVVTNGDVESSSVIQGESGRTEIEIVLTEAGAERFSRATESNVGKILGILVDGQLISAPRVQEKISGRKALITGAFSDDEARRIANGIHR